MHHDMHRVLARLADIGVADGEERVTKLFEWAFNYSMEWAKIVIAFGASLVTSFLLAYFKGTELNQHLEVARWAFAGAILTVVAGLIYYWRIRRTRSEYVYGLHLYSQLELVVPYLKESFRSVYELLM